MPTGKRPKPPTWTRQELTQEVVRLLRKTFPEPGKDVEFLLTFFTGIDLEGIILELRSKQ